MRERLLMCGFICFICAAGTCMVWLIALTNVKSPTDLMVVYRIGWIATGVFAVIAGVLSVLTWRFL